MNKPIADFLLELERTLECDRRSKVEILAEVEDHLRAASAAAVMSGLAIDTAEEQAISAFGEPELLGRRFGDRPTRRFGPIAIVATGSLLAITAFGLGLQSSLPSDGSRNGITLGWAQRLEDQAPASRSIPPPAHSTLSTGEPPIAD